MNEKENNNIGYELIMQWKRQSIENECIQIEKFKNRNNDRRNH